MEVRVRTIITIALIGSLLLLAKYCEGNVIKATVMKNKCICMQSEVAKLRQMGATEAVIQASCKRIVD